MVLIKKKKLLIVIFICTAYLPLTAYRLAFMPVIELVPSDIHHQFLFHPNNSNIFNSYSGTAILNTMLYKIYNETGMT